MPYWDHDKSRRDSAPAFIVVPWAYYSLRGASEESTNQKHPYQPPNPLHGIFARGPRLFTRGLRNRIATTHNYKPRYPALGLQTTPMSEPHSQSGVAPT